MSSLRSLRFLLLQVRDLDDPMRKQERTCFVRALQCDERQLHTHDLIFGAPPEHVLRQADIVLIGGSGDYSVVQGGPWLEESLETMRTLVRRDQPTFASCWGFQAMARALGGKVVTSSERAELGTLTVKLTPAGRAHPLTRPLGPSFAACMGHKDAVVELPLGAELLAYSDRAPNQAFCLVGKPIVCTQFHPELQKPDLLERLETYPEYVEHILGVTHEQFIEHCVDTPEANQLISRFVQLVVDSSAGDARLD